MSDIFIYEFSRAFDNVHYSQHYDTWVSGGYSPEKIARWNQEVPPVIRELVINGYFALNDNYPPESGEVALIAREIQVKNEHNRNVYYSILAVANRQMDDGGRPTIGYRYFWISTYEQQDVDGILTLLNWWNKNQLKFNMEDLESKSPLSSMSTDKVKELFLKRNWDEPWFVNHYQNPANQEEYIPNLKFLNGQNNEQAKNEFHYFSCALSKRINLSINLSLAWAWNVRRLQRPEAFISICCATNEDLSAISYRHKFSTALSIVNSGRQQSKKNHTKATEREERGTGDPPPIDEIRKCLTELARIFASKQQLDSQKSQDFFAYLAQYSNKDWQQFIDKTTLKAPTNDMKIAYEALLALVIPQRTYRWLSELIESLSVPGPLRFRLHRSQEIALSFQQEILDARLQPGRYEEARSLLIDTVHQGISDLLSEIITNYHKRSYRNSKYKKNIFFITKLNTVWSKNFRSYTDIVWDEISSSKEPSSQFCEVLCDAVENLRRSRQARERYLPIAQLCRNFGQENLSALLYVLCGEDISEKFSDSVYNAVVAIIVGPSSQDNDDEPPPPSGNGGGSLHPTLLLHWFSKFLNSFIFKILIILIALAISWMEFGIEITVLILAIVFSSYLILTTIIILFSSIKNRNSIDAEKHALNFICFMLGIGIVIWTLFSISSFFDSIIEEMVTPQSPANVQKSTEEITSNSNEIQQGIKTMEDFEKQSGLDPANLIENIIIPYIPDPNYRYAKEQAILVRRYLINSQNDNDFIKRKKHIQKCKNKGDANFEKCIEPNEKLKQKLMKSKENNPN